MLIERNLFQGHAGQALGFSSTSSAAPATGITIQQNTFADNGRGLYAFNLTSSAITRNLFNDSTAASADIRIFEGSSDLAIDHNLLMDGDGRAYRANNIGTGSGDPFDIHLNRNSITGYAGPDGVVQNDVGLPTLDAECNWWGSAAGPGPADTEGDVDFVPWLSDTDLDGPCVVDDSEGPEMTITTPADGATYERGSTVIADYECTDPSGTPVCSGPVADGDEIDTDVVGHFSFTVNAEDGLGNTSSETNEYDVTIDGCSIDEDPATKTMTFLGDCTVDHSFLVPDGYTVDGDGFTLFGVDRPMAISSAR